MVYQDTFYEELEEAIIEEYGDEVEEELTDELEEEEPMLLDDEMNKIYTRGDEELDIRLDQV